MTALSRVLAAGVSVLALGSLTFAAVLAETKYKIDPVHSSVGFRIKHMDTANFYGRFNEVSGTVTTDGEGNITALEATVPVESIDTHNKQRDEHVKSPDYFDAKQFPTITFKSTKVEGVNGVHRVTGDLTIRGVTKSVQLEVEKTGSGQGMGGKAIVGYEAKVKIKRTDFGMPEGKGLSDEVELMASFEAGAE